MNKIEFEKEMKKALAFDDAEEGTEYFRSVREKYGAKEFIKAGLEAEMDLVNKLVDRFKDLLLKKYE